MSPATSGDQTLCAWAVQVSDLVPDQPRGVPVYGLVVHCTGRGVVSKAKKLGISPIECALAYYPSAAHSAHYVCDYDGTLYQITADDRRVPHVGLELAARARYLSGKWKLDVSASGLDAWRARWGDTTPASLYPSRFPNTDYVGCELLPRPETLESSKAEWYTAEQYRTVARLALDLRRRHKWPPNFALKGRLVGHEDLSPLTRWDRGGGWDPGARRKAPRFFWSRVIAALTSAANLEGSVIVVPGVP